LFVGGCLLVIVGDSPGARSQIPVPPKRTKGDAAETKATQRPSAEPAAKNAQSRPRPVVTQQSNSGNPSYRETVRAREAVIREKLTKPISIDKRDVPLRQMLDDLCQTLGLQMAFDRTALRDAALDPESITVSLQVRDVSARAALEMVLHEQNLDWAVRHEVLWITTRDVAAQLLTTQVYAVADLVFNGEHSEAGGYDADFDSLIELISCAVEPQMWSVVGGPATIDSFGRGESYVVVVTHAWRGHEAIAQLLADLRAVVARPAARRP
jgi:hypothetical protein